MNDDVRGMVPLLVGLLFKMRSANGLLISLCHELTWCSHGSMGPAGKCISLIFPIQATANFLVRYSVKSGIFINAKQPWNMGAAPGSARLRPMIGGG